jgi:rare lipoprotein A
MTSTDPMASAPLRQPHSGKNCLPALGLSVLFALLLQACSSTRPVTRSGVPEIGVERGVASWYGPGFNGKRTASGERYDMHDLTAAHRTLPFGTRIEVRNLANDRTIVVTINDRGPFKKQRIVDLSYAAAKELEIVGPGTGDVELQILGQRTLDTDSLVFTVQIGAFSDLERAVTAHHDLQRLYPEAFVDADGVWNRVRVGLFPQRENAESLRRELAAQGISAIVVTSKL